MRLSLRAWTLTAVLFVAACPGGKRATDPDPQRSPGAVADAPPAADRAAVDAPQGTDAMSQPIDKAPTPPGTFTRGPDLTPAGDLVTWLDGQRTDLGQRKVRLPVWLTVAGTSIKAARIGAADRPDAVALQLKDAALGISLVDHARRACKGGPACGLWLEGTWRGGGVFDVSKVGAAFTAADDAGHVEVEP